MCGRDRESYREPSAWITAARYCIISYEAGSPGMALVFGVKSAARFSASKASVASGYWGEEKLGKVSISLGWTWYHRVCVWFLQVPIVVYLLCVTLRTWNPYLRRKRWKRKTTGVMREERWQLLGEFPCLPRRSGQKQWCTLRFLFFCSFLGKMVMRHGTSPHWCPPVQLRKSVPAR